MKFEWINTFISSSLFFSLRASIYETYLFLAFSKSVSKVLISRVWDSFSSWYYLLSNFPEFSILDDSSAFWNWKDNLTKRHNQINTYFHNRFMSSFIFFKLLFRFFKLNLEEFDLLLQKSLFFLVTILRINQLVLLFFQKIFILDILIFKQGNVINKIILKERIILFFMLSKFLNITLELLNIELRFF